MKKNSKFWFLYVVSWSAYTMCLGAVFISVGNPINVGLLLTLTNNVLPACLLGIIVVYICRGINWTGNSNSKFIGTHIILLFTYASLWCFLTLVGISLQTFFNTGVLNFIKWDNFAVLWQFFSGVMAYTTISSSVYLQKMNTLLQLEEMRNNELRIRAIRAESARTQAELSVLRAQLNPHFVFNTLHSLMGLIRIDTNMAETAIERFALMLRYVLKSQNKKEIENFDVRFKDEWDFVLNYLEIEKLRLGDRLQLITEISPSVFNYLIPAFSIQPLVENAIKHSISKKTKGGWLRIEANKINNRLFVKITNNGADKVFDKNNSNGLGLYLVSQSLLTRFGVSATLSINTSKEDEFEVSLNLPIVSQ
jgi:sensor histidine kinase YesM